MSEFYMTLTTICFSIAALIGLTLLATFDLTGAARQRREARQIRAARRTIERYNLDRVLTDNERKAVVLEYLNDTGKVLTRGGGAG